MPGAEPVSFPQSGSRSLPVLTEHQVKEIRAPLGPDLIPLDLVLIPPLP